VSPVVDDDFPAPDVIAAANVELVALVRRRLPEGFCGGERWWALFATEALARMADTVESLMTLMASGHDTDGQTLLRSLYEQAVTFAWIAIEPDGRQIRWRDDGRWEMLKLHRDALTVGLTILSDAEVDDTKNGLSLTDRKQPEADRVLPPVPERALRADEHWSAQISGLHPPNHPLSLRGIYMLAYRAASRPAHGSMVALDAYVTEKNNRRVVHRAEPGSRLTWALVAPLFGIALTIAAQHLDWIDEGAVRALVGRATGPEPPP
jgi:hypothetical protein